MEFRDRFFCRSIRLFSLESEYTSLISVSISFGVKSTTHEFECNLTYYLIFSAKNGCPVMYLKCGSIQPDGMKVSLYLF